MSNKQNIVITPNLTNTSQIIYSKIYIDEFIILIRFALAVLVASIIYKYISTYFIIPYQKHFWFITLFVIILCSALSVIMIELITYIKLRNNRDLYLKELTNISFLSGINQ
jgi:hypothetical protein